MHDLPLHPPTLWLATLAVAACATALAAAWAAAQSAPRRGWPWAAVAGVVAAGAALQFLPQPLAWGVPALWLQLLWPLAALHALRRFDARRRLPGSPRLDMQLAALTALAVLAGQLRADPVLRQAQGVLLAAVLPAGVAVLLARVPRAGAALRALTALLVSGATLQAVLAWQALDGRQATPALALLLNALLAAATAGMPLLLVRGESLRALRESRLRLALLAQDRRTLPSDSFELLARALLRRQRREAAVLLLAADPHGPLPARDNPAWHAVTRGLPALVRVQDLAGRHDRALLLLLPATPLRRAMAATARMSRSAQALAAVGAPDAATLSLSVGVGQLRPGEALALGLERAQQALAEAQRQGRGRAVGAASDGRGPVFVESRGLGWTAP